MFLSILLSAIPVFSIHSERKVKQCRLLVFCHISLEKHLIGGWEGYIASYPQGLHVIIVLNYFITISAEIFTLSFGPWLCGLYSIHQERKSTPAQLALSILSAIHDHLRQFGYNLCLLNMYKNLTWSVLPRLPGIFMLLSLFHTSAMESWITLGSLPIPNAVRQKRGTCSLFHS